MDLVIDTYGANLSKRDDLFFLKIKKRKYEFAPVKIDSILITNGIRVSSDALMLAVESEIPVFFIARSKNVRALVWTDKYGSISTIRKNQALFTGSVNAIDWIRNLVIYRIRQQIALISYFAAKHNTLWHIDSISKSYYEYVEKAEDYKNNDFEQAVKDLRGFEAQSGRLYFRHISDLLPYDFKFAKRTRRPALDKFNCLLNYALGILYGKIEYALILAGLDPYIGIFHTNRYNKPVLSFDFIEFYRHWAEFVVVKTILNNEVNKKMFDVDKKNAHWLNSKGRTMIIKSMMYYLDDTQKEKKRNIKRINLLMADAKSFASDLLKNQN